jgi:hypothetical protein
LRGQLQNAPDQLGNDQGIHKPVEARQNTDFKVQTSHKSIGSDPFTALNGLKDSKEELTDIRQMRAFTAETAPIGDHLEVKKPLGVKVDLGRNRKLNA